MRLYQLPYSHYSAKVRIVAAEKGVELEMPDIPGGSTGSEAYRAINPHQKVPTLVDGELVLPESEVIVEYLEDRFPEPRMLPEAPQDRAESRYLSRFHDLYLAPQLSALYAGTRQGATGTEAGQRMADELHALFALLEGRIRPAPWLLGAEFMLSDATYALSFWYAVGLSAQYGQPVTESDYPKAFGWWGKASARPSVAATVDVARRALGL